MAQVRPVIFLKEVKTELDKVSWPSRQEAVRLTSIVIGVSLIVGVFIGILDFIFAKIMEYLVQR